MSNKIYETEEERKEAIRAAKRRYEKKRKCKQSVVIKLTDEQILYVDKMRGEISRAAFFRYKAGIF